MCCCFVFEVKVEEEGKKLKKKGAAHRRYILFGPWVLCGTLSVISRYDPATAALSTDQQHREPQKGLPESSCSSNNNVITTTEMPAELYQAQLQDSLLSRPVQAANYGIGLETG